MTDKPVVNEQQDEIIQIFRDGTVVVVPEVTGVSPISGLHFTVLLHGGTAVIEYGLPASEVAQIRQAGENQYAKTHAGAVKGEEMAAAGERFVEVAARTRLKELTEHRRNLIAKVVNWHSPIIVEMRAFDEAQPVVDETAGTPEDAQAA